MIEQNQKPHLIDQQNLYEAKIRNAPWRYVPYAALVGAMFKEISSSPLFIPATGILFFQSFRAAWRVDKLQGQVNERAENTLFYIFSKNPGQARIYESLWTLSREINNNSRLNHYMQPRQSELFLRALTIQFDPAQALGNTRTDLNTYQDVLDWLATTTRTLLHAVIGQDEDLEKLSHTMSAWHKRYPEASHDEILRSVYEDLSEPVSSED